MSGQNLNRPFERLFCALKNAADIFYNRLCVAVERQALEQIRMLEHEIAIVRARRLSIDNGAIREAEAYLAKARELLRREGGE
jgi:hypothetical protein